MHPYWYNPTFNYVDQSGDVSRQPCRIGHEVWIGANVTILPNCREIGVGAVIGANSVVTRNIPPFTVWAGVPAKQIRQRFGDPLQNRLMTDEPWLLEPVSYRDYQRQLSSDLA